MTRDHVVARRWYNPRQVPTLVAELNKVPACAECNVKKADKRSDCECSICEAAWEIMAPFILPRRKCDIPVIPILAERGWSRRKEDGA